MTDVQEGATVAATVGETGLGGDFTLYEAGTKDRVGTLRGSASAGWTFKLDAKEGFGRIGDIAIADEWGDFAGVLNVKPAPVVAKEIKVSGTVVNVPGSTVEVTVDNPTTLVGDGFLTIAGTDDVFGILNVTTGKLVLDRNLSAGLVGDIAVEGVIGDGVKVFGIIKLKPAPAEVEPCINFSGTLSVTDFREGNTVDLEIDNTTSLSGDIFVKIAGTDNEIIGKLNVNSGKLELDKNADWSLVGDLQLESTLDGYRMCGFLKILPADDDDDKDPVDPVKPCINVAGTLSVTDFRNGATVDVDVTNTTTLEFQCGKVVRHTAFIGEGGETVRIELTGDGTGFAEIVPHAEG